MAQGLRIVSFNVFPMAHALVAGWANRHGHQIVLVVTSPSPKGERYGEGHRELVAGLPPSQDVLVTARMRRTAAPVIAALAPDLIISATFPHRIPPEVTAIPRYGALNLHPAPLPRGRGPNPQRLIYEGELTVAGTLHRIVPEFDAGAILGQRTRRLPADLSSTDILSIWEELLVGALEEGVPRAVDGDPGELQDETLATYAAPFSEAERWLTWNEPAHTIHRRTTALNMLDTSARAIIDGQPMSISRVRARPGPAPEANPGTVLNRTASGYVIQVGDGAVEVEAETALTA